MKILETFKTINPDWLLLGKQPMFRGEKARIEPDLFAENPVNPGKPTPTPEKSKESEPKANEIIPEKIINQEITTPNQLPVFSSKKIDKIMILYSDKTFESFSPD
jgi:hypothetical protein